MSPVRPPWLADNVLTCMTVLVLAGFGSLALRAAEAPEAEDRGRPLRQEAAWSVPFPLEVYAAEQEAIHRQFQQTTVLPVQRRNAYILSELWRAGLLKDEIKEPLVQEHYHVVLFQIFGNDNAPNFVVRCFQTFPFPNTWTAFTPTLYLNDKVEWAPGRPQTEHAMCLNNSTLTNRTGGVVGNGDVLQYRIDLQQTEPSRDLIRNGNTEREAAASGPKRVWKTSLWTNKVVARGLKETRPVIEPNRLR
jgi:hypothetical protein